MIVSETMGKVGQGGVSFDDPLQQVTPSSWASYVVTDLPTLLCDHAHCERKAAAFAIGLLQRYCENNPFVVELSKLAREEMRHFEMVLSIMSSRNFTFGSLAPARYASYLRGLLSKEEPNRLLDQLIIAGLIEARSCERFLLLHPYLCDVDPVIARFYKKLYSAERRHFLLYFEMAQKLCGQLDVENRLQVLSESESRIILQEDSMIRFHSGKPPIE